MIQRNTFSGSIKNNTDTKLLNKINCNVARNFFAGNPSSNLARVTFGEIQKQ